MRYCLLPAVLIAVCASGDLCRGQTTPPRPISPERAAYVAAAPRSSESPTAPQGALRQVMLQVRMLELNRTKLRADGIEFALERPKHELSATNAADQLFEQRAVGTSCRVEEADSKVLKELLSLQAKGHVRVLAEPTLVTVSDRPCQFNNGGEIPVPVAGNGGPTIEYKKYGTQLDAKPVLGDDDTLRLDLRTRISELDRDHSVTVAGQTVPALHTREVETTTTLRLGQVLIVAGSRQERKVHATAKPGAGDKTASPAAAETTEQIETLLLVRATAVSAQEVDSNTQPAKQASKVWSVPATRNIRR